MIKLPKLKRKDFERIFREGKKISSPEFTIYWQKNQKILSRWAIIVSQKLSKKAVIRNKLKRQLREILRKEGKEIKGFDLIIIPRPLLLEKNFSDLQEILRENLKQIKK